MSELPSRIFDLHDYQNRHYPKEDALASKVDGRWERVSTQKFIQLAGQLSTGLLKAGIKPGDRVAMVSNNRFEWHIADLAILQIGAVNVPIYPTITEEDYEYILNDAEAKLIFVSDVGLYEKISNVKPKVKTLQSIYTFDEIAGSTSWKTLLIKEIDQAAIDNIRKDIKHTDLATLIYTSGTTGMPKGVMLSHENLVSNVLASKERLPCDQHSKALSFLPLCHVYERMVTYLYIYNGVSIYYAESMDTIGENLREVKPEVFTAVPRVLEKVYDRIVAKGNELKGLKKKLFFWALNLGLQYDLKGKSPMYKLQLALANKLIFNKWREALGGKTLAVASGSAALQPRLARVFLSAGIPVMEGYGLTETSPVIAVNCAKNDGIRIGTVGRPLSNMEVKIAEDGEILVKGPNVMMGYYKNEAQTREVLSQDGWLHTGDIGVLEDGFLRITDRKKEIFKTSGGKYIAPQVVENKLKESLFIEQSMVVGEYQKHPSAIIQPAFDYLREWCGKNGISYTSAEEVITHQKVLDQFQKELDRLNETFAQYEKVKQFRLVPDVWSIEGGEMTPTLKLRRKNIKAKYQHLIDDIYK